MSPAELAAIRRQCEAPATPYYPVATVSALLAALAEQATTIERLTADNATIVAQARDVARRLVDAEEDATDLQALFDQQQKRERPWIERWRRETGKELSLPDYGEMLGWIIGKADAAEATLAAMREAATELLAFMDRQKSAGPLAEALRTALASMEARG